MISTVAVGLDGSQTSAKALEAAVEVARRFDAKVVLISALRDSSPGHAEEEWATNPSARVHQLLESTESRLKSSGLTCETRVDEGDPGDVLVRLADECGADLLVVGNKGMNRRILGSVPNTVAHKATCSVLVVKTT